MSEALCLHPLARPLVGAGAAVLLLLSGPAWAQEDGARPVTPSFRPAVPIPVQRPKAASSGALAKGKGIEIATPPPEAGAVEFGAEPAPAAEPATGLIRTDVFGENMDPDEEGEPLEMAGNPELASQYQGIMPGARDDLPTFKRYKRRKRPYLTWVGFRPIGNGRVFLKITRPVAFNIAQVSETEYHLDLQDARLAFRNDRRPLDASFFPGNLLSVQARSLGRDGVRVVLKLKKPGRPTIRQQSSYVFVDLP